MKKMILSIAALALAISMDAQTKVSEATTWNWDTQENNAVIADSYIDYNGLYIRGNKGSHEIVAKKSGQIIKKENFKAKFATFQQGNNFWTMVKPNTTPDNPSGGLDRCYAVQTEKAGTLTVYLKPREGVEDRYAKLLFNGKEVASEELDSTALVELTYTADKSGIFYFGASCAYYVFLVKYTPSAE